MPAKFLWACAAILTPAPLITTDWVPMPVRAASAMLCGLAVLLSGPYLVGRFLDGDLWKGVPQLKRRRRFHLAALVAWLGLSLGLAMVTTRN